MHRKHVSLAAFWALYFSGFAQGPVIAQEPASDSWKERGVALGINYAPYLFAEVGHYRSGALPLLSSSLTYGSEFSYLDGVVVAPKMEGRVHVLFFNASLASLWYTDFSSSSLKLRPEIGLGSHRIGLNYGYTATLVNQDFTKFNRHLISLRYYVPVRVRARRVFDRQGQRIP
jgi:hypothetical protein